MIVAYVALGSNLDNPRQHVLSALQELTRLPATTLTAQSSLYQSSPWCAENGGAANQPDYINAVAALSTGLSAHELLDLLLEIETAHGRIRGATRWGPRTLDLDLLVFGATQLHDARLDVPHPRLHERNFVLYPLHEIAPQMRLADGQMLTDLLARCPAFGLTRLPDQL